MSKQPSGFSLVQLIIVLAIASMLMIITFLAVGSSQRAVRDTARKDAVNRLVESIRNDEKTTGQWDTCDVGTCTLPTGWTSPGNPVLSVVFAPNSYPVANTTTIWWTSNHSAPNPPAGCVGVYGNLDGWVGVNLESGSMFCQEY